MSAKPDETQRVALTIAIGNWPSFSQMPRIQFRCLENIQYMTTDNFSPGGRADVLIVDYDFRGLWLKRRGQLEVENRVEKSLYRQLASEPNFLCRIEGKVHMREKIVFRIAHVAFDKDPSFRARHDNKRGNAGKLRLNVCR